MSKEVLKPKGPFDKTLQRVAHQKLWEALPEAVAYVRLVVRGRVRADKDRLMAVRLLLDRTIPTVQRVDATAFMGVMVQQQEEGEKKPFDWSQFQRATSEALEEIEQRDDGDARIH